MVSKLNEKAENIEIILDVSVQFYDDQKSYKLIKNLQTNCVFFSKRENEFHKDVCNLLFCGGIGYFCVHPTP